MMRARFVLRAWFQRSVILLALAAASWPMSARRDAGQPAAAQAPAASDPWIAAPPG